MPKRPLIAEQAKLESDIVSTMMAAFREWRPDLSYPESHSDMEACARGLLQMFNITRAPLPNELKYDQN